MRKTNAARRALTAILVGCLMLPQALWAQSAVDDAPNEWAMVGDLLVARPLGLAMTVGGTAVWLGSLPFTLLAGHAGYTHKDIDRVRAARAGNE